MASGKVHGIRDFYAAADKNDFLRDFNFRLRSISTRALALTEEEIIYSYADILPGRNIQNHKQPFMGLEFNYAGSAQYPGSEAYKITFFIDTQGSVREKLERASRIVFNDLSSTGDYAVPGLDQIITVSLIDPKLEVIRDYNLIGAQFRKISDLKMDYIAGKGELVKCECEIAYQFYTVSTGSDQTIVS